MDLYKIELVDPITFQSQGVHETEIPVALVDAVRAGLNNLTTPEVPEDYIITPVIVSPNLREVSFGVLENTPEGTKFRFVVALQTKDNWDNNQKQEKKEE